jgi:WD40 repeat protein
VKTHFGVLMLTLALFPLLSPGQQHSKDLVEPSLAGRAVTLKTLAFSPDGRFLAAGSGETAAAGDQEESGEIAIWDLKTLQVRMLHKLDKGVPSVGFSRDSKTLAVGTWGDQCVLFDVETAKVQATLSGHGQAARGVAFSPDGQTLAVGSYDGAVRLWDYRAGKLLQTLKGHTNWIYCVAYSPDGSILASSSKDESVRLWDAATGKPLKTWDGYGGLLRSVAFDPKGRWLATPCQVGTLKVRTVPEGKILANYIGTGTTDWVAVLPSGKSMVVGHLGDASAKVFAVDFREATTEDEKRIGELIARWDDDRMVVREKASQEMQDMGWIAEPFLTKVIKDAPSAEARMRARLARAGIRSPRPAAELRFHQNDVRCGAFSADGQLLATGAKDGLVVLWDAATYKVKSKLSWPDKGP